MARKQMVPLLLFTLLRVIILCSTSEIEPQSTRLTTPEWINTFLQCIPNKFQKYIPTEIVSIDPTQIAQNILDNLPDGLSQETQDGALRNLINKFIKCIPEEYKQFISDEWKEFIISTTESNVNSYASYGEQQSPQGIPGYITCWEQEDYTYAGYRDPEYVNNPDYPQYTEGDVCDHTDPHSIPPDQVRNACRFEVVHGDCINPDDGNGGGACNKTWSRKCTHSSTCPEGWEDSSNGCIEIENKRTVCCCQEDFCNTYMEYAILGWADPGNACTVTSNGKCEGQGGPGKDSANFEENEVILVNEVQPLRAAAEFNDKIPAESKNINKGSAAGGSGGGGNNLPPQGIPGYITCWEQLAYTYAGFRDPEYVNNLDYPQYTEGDVCDHTDPNSIPPDQVRNTCRFEVVHGDCTNPDDGNGGVECERTWSRKCTHSSTCPEGWENAPDGCIEIGNKRTVCCCQQDFCNTYMEYAILGWADPNNACNVINGKCEGQGGSGGGSGRGNTGQTSSSSSSEEKEVSLPKVINPKSEHKDIFNGIHWNIDWSVNYHYILIVIECGAFILVSLCIGICIGQRIGRPVIERQKYIDDNVDI